MQIVDKFTTQLKNVLTRALCLAVERGESKIIPEYLLWALGTQTGSVGSELLRRAKIKEEDLRALIKKTTTVTETKTPAMAAATPLLSNEARRVVERAVLTAATHEHHYVGTEHLLFGLLEPILPEIEHFFQTKRTKLADLRRQIRVVLKSTAKFHDLTQAVAEETRMTAVKTKEAERETHALDYFCVDLTDPERQKQADPVIGREPELERLVQILCRRHKNNPLLLGDPGIGKTAIVEGLAGQISRGQAPWPLHDKRILMLDLALVVAGTVYRGEFEGRLKQLLDEIKQEGNVILFIDEIHTIVGAGSAIGTLDAANILKPALARGEIHCIGATTMEEYKKQFESDPALERRFSPIIITEPDLEKTKAIVAGLRRRFEEFHGLRITDEAVEAAVTLSSRYLPERRQPDKALDLLDETAAAVRVRSSITPSGETAARRRGELQRLRREKERAVKEERFADALILREREEETRDLLSKILQKESTPTKIITVSASDVIQVAHRVTGVPVALLTEEYGKHRELEKRLAERVIGQESAVQAVAAAVRRAQAGVQDPHRPLSSFIFLGPSGVGKTELAKAIAQEIFQDPTALLTLDMSEYAEAFGVSKLIGSPAGYVGYREAAKLTDRVKQRPYSIVLFDEIEKAHPDVSNLLLQILENGVLTDATGRTVNFKQTIIVLTSNLGAEHFNKPAFGFADQKITNPLTLTDELRAILHERFRPELLNRLSQIVLFQPLTQAILIKIADKLINELTARLKDENVNLTCHPSVAACLANRADQRLGARDLRRLIQLDLENPVAEIILKKRQPRPLHLKAKTTTGKIHIQIENGKK